MDYLSNKNNFLVIGAARSGISVATFLADKGKDVVLSDAKEYEKLVKEGFGIEKLLGNERISLRLGSNPDEVTVLKADAVILSPGVSPDIPACNLAKEHGIDVISEVELANKFFNGKIVAITGTNGKTTTTHLTQQLLSHCGKNAFVCGNIGLPFIDYVNCSGSDNYAALEISSFQLSMCEDMTPIVAVITNITPDHLDRHKTMENYIAAKANVFKNMKSDSLLILNYDDDIVRGLAEKAKCRVAYFSLKNKAADAYLDGDNICLKNFGKVINVDEMQIIGPHNAANAMCALLCAKELGCDLKEAGEALKYFKPVEHRVEFVRELDGVKYINDSKGTNPDATITAVNSFSCPLIMILGGYDKKNSFDELFELLKDKAKHIFVLGQTAEKIIETANRFKMKNYTYVESLEEAVLKAHDIAEAGDCVLLSPACASWGMFDDYEQRGRLFKEDVLKLK